MADVSVNGWMAGGGHTIIEGEKNNIILFDVVEDVVPINGIDDEFLIAGITQSKERVSIVRLNLKEGGGKHRSNTIHFQIPENIMHSSLHTAHIRRF